MSRYAVAVTATLGFLISKVESSFQAQARDNVAAYWAQGSNQDRLLETCKNPNVDVVVIDHVKVSSDQARGDVGSDIIACQEIYGKKIMLSFGREYPSKDFIGSDHDAVSFANFLWGAFGPVTDSWTADKGPRPFGSAVVDGFDFDVESEISKAATFKGKPINGYKVQGHVKMIETLKQALYPTDTTKEYFISGSPQCMVPDEQFARVAQSAWFDWLFIHYRNTPVCAEREGLNYVDGAGSVAAAFKKWTKVHFLNKKATIYLGLSGSSRTSQASEYYLTPLGADLLIREHASGPMLGGVMLWEVSSAVTEVVCNKPYLTWMKQLLVAAQTNSYIDTTTTHCTSDGESIQSRMIKRQAVDDPTLPQSSTPSSVPSTTSETPISTTTVASEVPPTTAPSTTPELATTPSTTSETTTIPVTPVDAAIVSTTSSIPADAAQLSSTTILLTTPAAEAPTTSESSTTEESTSSVTATVTDAVLPVTTVTPTSETPTQVIPTGDAGVEAAPTTQLPTTTPVQELPAVTAPAEARTVTVTSTITYTITADGTESVYTTVVPLTTTLDPPAAAAITPGPPTRTIVLTSTLTNTITLAADETITSYATQYHTIALAMNPENSLHSPHEEERNTTRTTRVTRTETVSLTVTVAALTGPTGSTITVADWVTLTKFAAYNAGGTGVPRAGGAVVNRVYNMNNSTGAAAAATGPGGANNRLVSTATGTAPIVQPTGGGARLSTSEASKGALAAVVVCVMLLLA